MNLIVKRVSCESSGIYSDVLDEAGNKLFVVMEHAYQKPLPGGAQSVINGNGWEPKLPNGTYVCRLGEHQLHSGPIKTFEVIGVPGHAGILWHTGNTEKDSEGCLLLGSQRVANSVINSKVTFAKFMDLQSGVDEFKLTVEG